MNRRTECFLPGLRSLRHMGILTGTFMAVLLAGCGGDGSSSTTPPTTVPTTAVQINMGDAPADWLLAFSMNVSTMTLTHSDGSSITIANTATPIEMIHRLGTMEAVATRSIPQGKYSGASMTIASCTLSYLDSVTHKPVQKTIDGPFNASLTFGSDVTVGTTPLALNFDLDLLHSLSGDTGGAFQFSPQFHFSVGSSSSSGNGSGNGDGMNARNGGMYQMMGVVGGTGTGTFYITAAQSMNAYAFKVNEQTRYQGRISNMNQLTAGMGVLVTAALQSDGSFLATRVRATMGAAGAMGGGVITEVVGMPATQLTIVMQNGAGASVNTDYLSKTLTVNLTDTTTYEIDTDRVSLAGLPFEPIFDASNIYAGQSVLPLSEDAIVANTTCDPTCGTITASTVRLRERGMRGTATVDITPGATTSFTLTLPTDCAFTTLTGATEVLVYQQPSTNVEDATAIVAGTTLRVHGLLFKVGTGWVLVASTISST